MFSSVRFIILLLAGLSLGMARPAWASHAVGGSITYTSLGGTSYRVRVDFFRDCASIAPPGSFTLNCQTTCGSPAQQTLGLPLVAGPFMGTPYGSMVQAQVICPSTGAAPGTPGNFATYRYEGTVTLLPNRWTLSVEEASRPTVANASAGTMRLEATLDNRTLTNTSVAFSNVPVLFVPNGQPNLLHIGAFDADGDSLAYEMVKPLTGCGTYETFNQYPVTVCQPYVISTSPLCLLNCSFPPSNFAYSARLPLPVTLDTVGTCPNKYLLPHFPFDSIAGTMGFTPNRYLNTPNAANGDNKYLVSVKVTEWRRVNGTYVMVGTTRRDMLWVIHDNSGNIMPRLAPTVTVQDGLQTRTQARTTPIPVLAGEPISVTFSATSPYALPLAYTLEQNTVPGATIQASTGRLTFTPPLSLPAGTYRVSVTLTDDAAPWRDMLTVPVMFKVYRTALATRSGSTQAIAAYPTPFTDRVQFQLPTPGVQALRVCDNLGRLVARLTSQPDGQVQWSPAPELPAGLYLARSADGKQVIRLLRSAAQ